MWAVISIALVLVVGTGGLIGLLLYLFSGGCDEGPFSDWNSTNARGDVVAEYVRACTGIGTFVDYSITLQLHGDEKATRLVEHSDPHYGYPKFLWIGDDALMIDLGKVTWVRSPIHKVAGVNITYVYSMGE